jgi:hypothetical protein
MMLRFLVLVSTFELSLSAVTTVFVVLTDFTPIDDRLPVNCMTMELWGFLKRKSP